MLYGKVRMFAHPITGTCGIALVMEHGAVINLPPYLP
jgi:hypothetical protein